MTTFDKWMNEKYNGNYGRYVDDFNFVGQDIKAMWHDIPKIRLFLKEKLGLDLHPKNSIYNTIIKDANLLVL